MAILKFGTVTNYRSVAYFSRTSSTPTYYAYLHVHSRQSILRRGEQIQRFVLSSIEASSRHSFPYCSDGPVSFRFAFLQHSSHRLTPEGRLNHAGCLIPRHGRSWWSSCPLQFVVVYGEIDPRCGHVIHKSRLKIEQEG